MARSQDTFNKKELEKKRQKKKKDKQEKKEERKLEGPKPVEFMYLDADGNLTSVPPDPVAKREAIKLEDIVISTPKQEKSDLPNFVRRGILKYFNPDKGYGFITDSESRESVFVHIDSMLDEIKENDAVYFELGKGPKGPVANGVKLA